MTNEQRAELQLQLESRAVESRLVRELLAENEQLLTAVRAAYWHLDTYGFPNHPDEALMRSQQHAFDLSRPHCPPIPGRL